MVTILTTDGLCFGTDYMYLFMLLSCEGRRADITSGYREVFFIMMERSLTAI